MRLRDFTVLTFDCYGTLIDWEAGLHAGLGPLLAHLARPLPREAVLEAFARHEAAQEAATPAMRYSDLLAVVHGRLAAEWGVAPVPAEAQAFGRSVPDWPAFADSAPALHVLQDHFKLVVLSNVDRASFAGSQARLGIGFDAVYTAEEIGSYKPDPRNFAFMLAALGQRGIAPGQILHVAQSLFHDHVPAKAAGLATAWIDRRHGMPGWGATPPPPVAAQADIRFTSLAALAQACRDGA